MKIRLLILSFFFSGFVFSQGRIIGGSAASSGEFPFIAGLMTHSEQSLSFGQFCGGSLICPNWVLTAAHCTEGETASTIDVFFKTIYLTNPESGFERIGVESLYVHPNFDSNTLDNDLALLKLKSNSAASVIKLPLPQDSIFYRTDTPLTVIGWGATHTNPDVYADTLQKVNLNVMDYDFYNDVSHYNGDLTPNMFLAGIPAGSKDACYGDSGGPLFKMNGSEPVLTGIVSWGYDCADPTYPGVYTKVYNYINWIKSVTKCVPDFPAAIIEENKKAAWEFKNNGQSFHLNLTSKSDQPIKYELYNSAASLINSGKYYNYIQTDLSELPTGLYFLRAVSGENTFSQTVMKY